jgi:hypothetical protein
MVVEVRWHGFFFQRVVWFLVLFCGFVGSCGGTFFSVDVLSAEGKGTAAATLQSLAVNPENKVTIVGAGAVPLLDALRANGTARGRRKAAGALANLVS